MSNGTQIEEAIKNVLKDQADRAGISTGLIQRVREFTGSTFAQTMVLGLMQEGEIAMSDLASFAGRVGVDVSAQAINKRFTSKTVDFFQIILNAAFTQVVAADPVAIPLLKRFSEVIVEDSTTLNCFSNCGSYMGRLIPLAARIPGICSVTFTPN